MHIITSNLEKYKEYATNPDYILTSHEMRNCGADRTASKLGLTSFRQHSGSGAILVVGSGPSRLSLSLPLSLPVLAINRAILDHPSAKYWAAHDIDSMTDVVGALKTLPTLITYSPNTVKERWGELLKYSPILVDVFLDPSRHKKRPLYWNMTTLGWVFDLLSLWGYGPIYTIGCELTQGGYVNPHFTDDELKRQHLGVRERVKEMFRPENKHKWASNVRIVDLSNGNLPVEKRDLASFLAEFRV